MKIQHIIWTLIFMLSIGIVSANNISWSIPVFVTYNGQVNLHAVDGYTNNTIVNFSVIVNDITLNYGRQFNITNTNISVDIIQGNAYEITYYQNSYLNTTTPPIIFTNVNNNYTASMNQTQITLLFLHGFSQQIINNRNISIVDNTYNNTYTTITGALYTNMPAGGINLTINAGMDYIPLNYILTLNPQQQGIVNVYLYPIVNVTIYDEKKSLINLTFFNFANPQLLRYTIYCINSNQTIAQLIPNTTLPGPYPISTACAYKDIKFDVQYLNPVDLTTVTYYRNLILPTNINTFNFDIFLVDLADNTPVLQTFLQPYDLFGQYTVQANTQIIITELMPSGTQLISSDIVDASGKVTEYLLQGAKYQITIMADGQPTKTLGNYYADQSGSQVLQLNNIAITTQGAATSATILANTVIAPVSDTQANIQVQYYDPINITQTVTLSIYNQTCTGIPLMQQSYNYLTLNGTSRQLVLTYNVFGSRYMNKSANQNFCGKIDRINTDFTTVSTESTVVYDTFINMPAQFKNPWTFPWIIMLLLTVIAMGANFRTAPMVSLIIAALATVLYSWNWFATGNIPGITASISLAVALLLAIVFNIKRSVM